MTDAQSGLNPNKVKASRKRLVVLLLIAFVPIFAAYTVFFHFPEWIPTGRTNEGELINPPIDGVTLSAELETYTSWALIQSVSGDCGEECRELLYLSRQVVTGLGKDTSRVQRVVIAESPLSAELRGFLETEHPDLKVITGSGEVFRQTDSSGPMLLLMDPNHNVMMRFSLEKAGKPMLHDLKHLLKVSNIG